MLVKRLKVSDRIELSFAKQSTRTGGMDDDVVMKCNDAPLPEFIEELQGMRTHAINVLEIPEEVLKPRLLVAGVKFRHVNADCIGVVLECVIGLEKSDNPVTVSTPEKYTAYGRKGMSDRDLMSPEFKDSTFRMLEEIKRYIRGERAQGDLFLDSSENETEDEGAEE